MASSNETLWIRGIFIRPPVKHGRERGSVSQSPRPEAVSVMLKSVPLMGNCLIKTDHLWTDCWMLIKCVKLGHWQFNTGQYSIYDAVLGIRIPRIIWVGPTNL